MLKAIKRACTLLGVRSDVDCIERESHGNLHKAMNLIQINKGLNKINVNGSDDYEFQFFHSLGKFLYNKRE